MQSDDTMLEANVFSYPEEDQLTNQRFQSRLKKRANTEKEQRPIVKAAAKVNDKRPVKNVRKAVKKRKKGKKGKKRGQSKKKKTNFNKVAIDQSENVAMDNSEGVPASRRNQLETLLLKETEEEQSFHRTMIKQNITYIDDMILIGTTNALLTFKLQESERIETFFECDHENDNLRLMRNRSLLQTEDQCHTISYPDNYKFVCFINIGLGRTAMLIENELDMKLRFLLLTTKDKGQDIHRSMTYANTTTES